jgi:hypothetical protein
MVLSEVAERLMMMSGPGASTYAAECGRTAASRLSEVATTTVPADIAGPVNRVRNPYEAFTLPLRCPTRTRCRRPRCSGE